jgi:hypothetical protein
MAKSFVAGHAFSKAAPSVNHQTGFFALGLPLSFRLLYGVAQGADKM